MTASDVYQELVEALVRLGRALRSNHHQLERAVGGVRGNDHVILAYLERHGTSRVGDVGDALGSSASVISRQVAALTAEGLVRRTTCPDDGRVGLLELSDAGLERLRAGRGAYRAYLTELLDDWDEQRKRDATELFNDLAEHVHRNLTTDETTRCRTERTA